MHTWRPRADLFMLNTILITHSNIMGHGVAKHSGKCSCFLTQVPWVWFPAFPKKFQRKNCQCCRGLSTALLLRAVVSRDLKCQLNPPGTGLWQASTTKTLWNIVLTTITHKNLVLFLCLHSPLLCPLSGPKDAASLYLTKQPHVKKGCPNLAKCSCFSVTAGWTGSHLCPSTSLTY